MSDHRRRTNSNNNSNNTSNNTSTNASPSEEPPYRPVNEFNGATLQTLLSDNFRKNADRATTYREQTVGNTNTSNGGFTVVGSNSSGHSHRRAGGKDLLVELSKSLHRR